ncbi:MAG: hypothetical protein H0W74_10755 [Sphingosinicella sp.]|nr:hypothetical protein [Sphingosinicella sp.]
MLAALSFSVSVGEVFVRSNPAVVEQMGLGNRARAHLNRTMMVVGAGQIKQGDARPVSAARGALRFQPLNPQALLVIAAAESQAGDRAGSVRLARLAERLSRRAFGAQLLLFQNALLKNNLSQALDHLSIAMRTADERHQSMLFPAVKEGLKIAQFRRGLAPVIDRRDEWASKFLIYAVDEGGAAANVSELFRNLDPRTRAFLAPTLGARTITRLIDEGQFDEARKMLAALPGKRSSVLSDPGLNAATLDPEIGSFGWQIGETPALTARVVSGKTSGTRIVMMDIGPGDSSVALGRILFMPAGNYVFSAEQRAISPESKISSSWIIHCLGDRQTRLTLNKARGASVPISADCPAQLIQLIVTQDDEASYEQLIVDSVALIRR